MNFADWVAIGELIALTACILACFRTLDHLIRQQFRERELLVNQIMHLSGKPWQEAPADVRPVATEDGDEPLVYLASPESVPLT